MTSDGKEMVFMATLDIETCLLDSLPSPVTRHPSPVTRHPSPVTRHFPLIQPAFLFSKNAERPSLPSALALRSASNCEVSS